MGAHLCRRDRIFIGVIGAWVVALTLESRFLDPTLGFGGSVAEQGVQFTTSGIFSGALDKHVALYLIVTFIAGFSESLVPNLLQRGEQAAGGERPDRMDAPIVERIQP